MLFNPLPGMPPDILRSVRKHLSRLEAEMLDRIITAGSTAAADAALGAAARAREGIETIMRNVMTMLGKLPHALANRIVDLDRGPNARRLTDRETALVREAFGNRVPPGQVRIVSGPGYSLFAMAAFRNGNPAITIGNTFYIKPDHPVTHADLSRTVRGVGLLLHEYTHVIQYAALGFAKFGSRYIGELRAHGSADELYNYENRDNDWANETLEGQAAIVGHYAALVHDAQTPERRALAEKLRAKLRNTGIYGN